MAEVALGKPTKASRQEAAVLIKADLLANWASEQAILIEKIDISSEVKAEAANIIRLLGGNTHNLPIAESRDGWLSFIDIANKKNWPHEVLIVHEREWNTQKDIDGKSILLPNVLSVKMGQSMLRGSFPYSIHEKKADYQTWNFDCATCNGATQEALSLAWGVNLQEVLEYSKLGKKTRFGRPFALNRHGKRKEAVVTLIQKPIRCLEL